MESCWVIARHAGAVKELHWDDEAGVFRKPGEGTRFDSELAAIEINRQRSTPVETKVVERLLPKAH